MKKGFLWNNGSLPQAERWWILSTEYEHHVENRSVFLKNWPCVTSFAIQFGQFLRTNMSLVCLHVSRQFLGRSTR